MTMVRRPRRAWVEDFVARPAEYGPLQKYDFEANGEWDIVVKDFGEVASRMGC